MNKYKATTNGAFIIKMTKKELATIKESTTKSGIILIEDRSFDSKQKTEATGVIVAGEHIGATLLVHPNCVVGQVNAQGNLSYDNNPYLFEQDTANYYFHINKELAYGYVKDEKITMFDNYALVEGNDIEDKVSSSGIILSVSNKRKFDELSGVIRHIAPHKELKRGDNVLLLKNSNFEYLVDGVKWWLIDDVNRKVLGKY